MYERLFQKCDADCLEQGTIRSVGVSNFEARHMEEVSKINGVIPAVNQIEYHPHFTRESIHHYCNQHGVFVQVQISLLGT